MDLRSRQLWRRDSWIRSAVDESIGGRFQLLHSVTPPEIWASAAATATEPVQGAKKVEPRAADQIFLGSAQMLDSMGRSSRSLGRVSVAAWRGGDWE